MSADDAALARIRERIDEVDAELQKLLNERAGLALEVGKVKQAHQGGATPVYYRPEREARILTSLKERNRGPLSDRDIARLFREIISCCLSLEQPLNVTYLGRPAPTPNRPRSPSSASSPAPSRWPASMRCSGRWKPKKRTTGWYRWRTPPRAWSTTPWTASWPLRRRS